MRPKQHHVDRHDEHFEAGVAVSVPPAGGPASEECGAEREDESGGIRQHVSCIRNEGEGVSEVPGESFNDDEGGREDEAGDKGFRRLLGVGVHRSMLAEAPDGTVQGRATPSCPFVRFGPAG